MSSNKPYCYFCLLFYLFRIKKKKINNILFLSNRLWVILDVQSEPNLRLIAAQTGSALSLRLSLSRTPKSGTAPPE